MDNCTELELKFNMVVKEMDKYKNRVDDLKSDNDTLLDVYGLFKQVVNGDCNIDEPSVFDLRAHAKYHAWNKFKGKSKEYSMKLYVIKVNKIFEKIKND
jgi:acyl-CoA-binding protein